jgi:ABC-type Fe3+ transport system permease subunit
LIEHKFGEILSKKAQVEYMKAHRVIWQQLGWSGIRRSVVLLLALLTPALTFAQNCALCYTQAGGSGSRMIHALKSGILILMIPPMCICIGLAVMAYKKRNQFNDDFDQN